MNKDLDFYGGPLSRPTDRDTSHQAERELRAGRLSKRRRLVLAVLKDHPGRTAKELGAILYAQSDLGDSARDTPQKRLPELRDAGYARMGTVRSCGVTGQKAHTWYPEEPRKDGHQDPV